MGKIYIIVGKSATGKDTIYQRVASDLKDKLKEVVPYTTRPIRDKEKNGREYFFLTEAEYEQLKAEEKIIEERAYQTMHGTWRYFTVKDGQFDLSKDSCIMLGTLEMYLQIQAYFGAESVVPIYIEVETGERLTRALEREKKQHAPKYTEMCRRFLADEADFAEEKIKAAKITKKYINDSLERCVNEVEQDILMDLKDAQ